MASNLISFSTFSRARTTHSIVYMIEMPVLPALTLITVVLGWEPLAHAPITKAHR